MSSGNPIVLLGTSSGIYRLEDDTVGPLSSDRESVTCLLRLPDGELAAGTTNGAVFCSRRKGGEWKAAHRGTEPIVALARVTRPRPQIVALDRSGSVWMGAGLGNDFEGDRVPLEGDLDSAPCLMALPSPSATVVVATASPDRLWVSDQASRDLTAHGEPLPGTPRALCCHPHSLDHWLLGTDRGLARSSDRGLHFEMLPSTPGPVRSIQFLRQPAPQLLVLTDPPDGSPEPADPSPLWVGNADGSSLRALPCSAVDGPRDPCGEILCASWAQRNREDVVLYGTDRGELLLANPQRQNAELIASGLPPILEIVPGSGGLPMDPESSGIHLLP